MVAPASGRGLDLDRPAGVELPAALAAESDPRRRRLASMRPSALPAYRRSRMHRPPTCLELASPSLNGILVRHRGFWHLTRRLVSGRKLKTLGARHQRKD